MWALAGLQQVFGSELFANRVQVKAALAEESACFLVIAVVTGDVAGFAQRHRFLVIVLLR
jgi:hypothetical protein